MADKVTKADLVEKIHEGTKVDQKDISNIIDLLFGEIKDSLKKGQTIELRGFGTFKVKYSSRKQARNPQTGELVNVTPRYKATFTPGKELKNELVIDEKNEK